MPEIMNLNAEARERAGKGPARATRRAGRIPGIIYGGDSKEQVLISLEPRDLIRAVHKAGFFATLVDVQVNGTTHRTLPRDVQFHPVTDRPMHVDFQRVGAGAQVHVEVPVAFVNHEKSPGLRRGGILNVVRHSIEMICAVESIPERLVVSLEGLDIGDSVHIASVELPQGARPAITDRDFTIASIATSSAVREEAAAAAAASVTGGEEPAAA